MMEDQIVEAKNVYIAALRHVSINNKNKYIFIDISIERNLTLNYSSI